MEFKEQKIKEFIEDLASDKASPGGGSTAALILSLSVALNKMVYSLSIGKKTFENLDEEQKIKMIQCNEESENFINKSFEYIIISNDIVKNKLYKDLGYKIIIKGDIKKLETEYDAVGRRTERTAHGCSS